VRDVAKSVLSEAVWRQQLSKLQAAAGQVIPARDAERIVEVTAKRHYLTADEQAAILGRLRESGDYTRWGLSSAVTRHAQELDYERASDLEVVGGRIASEAPKSWADAVGLN
jgi:hypothetical protein